MALTWTNRSIAGVTLTDSVAISGDGNTLVACSFDTTGIGDGRVYLSTDSGATWTYKAGAGERNYQQCAISTNGSIIAAVCNSSGPTAIGIAISIDSGATWSFVTPAGATALNCIAMSGSGTKILVADPTGGGVGGAVYLSTDTGVSYAVSAGAGTGVWFTTSMSRDGAVFGAGGTSLLMISTNGGATWNDRKPAAGDWAANFSSDGSKAIASQNDFLWRSINSGVAFATLAATAAFFTYIQASSDDGTIIALAQDDAGNVSYSTDSGVSWATQNPPGFKNWAAVSISADGTKIAVCDIGGTGEIWVATSATVQAGFRSMMGFWLGGGGGASQAVAEWLIRYRRRGGR